MGNKAQTGIAAAVDGALADPAAAALQPDLLPADPAAPSPAGAGKRRPGRPKGARSKRTEALAAEIAGRFGHPAIALAERYAFADLAEIVKRASVPPSRAVAIQVDALERLMRYTCPRPVPGEPPSDLARKLHALVDAMLAKVEAERVAALAAARANLARAGLAPAEPAAADPAGPGGAQAAVTAADAGPGAADRGGAPADPSPAGPDPAQEPARARPIIHIDPAGGPLDRPGGAPRKAGR